MVQYLMLQSLEEVGEMLWAEGPACLLLCGGTDILARPQPFGEKAILLDIHRIPALREIALEPGGVLRIGAAATHQAIVDHPLVQRRARVLAQACAAIGSLQIRNRGTLGGNLANASPAGDTLPALVCLDARLSLRGRDSQRHLSVAAFLRGPGETDLACHEFIEAVLVPAAGSAATVCFFKKAGHRRGMCCSKASVAFRAKLDRAGRLHEVRLALGAVAPTVIAVPEAERILEGQRLTPAAIEEAAEACRRATRAIDDLRSTAAYRRQVVGALAAEGLLELAVKAAPPRRTRRKPSPKPRRTPPRKIRRVPRKKPARRKRRR